MFEAAKGLIEGVGEITGLTTDGGTLFQTTFSKNDPYSFFNSMKSDSEKSEFIGLKELMEAIFHLVRNPAAHTPKINWKIDEAKALDVLTLISFAHKYLVECHVEPVVLLSKLNTKQHIEVEQNLNEQDLTAAENKTTYD